MVACPEGLEALFAAHPKVKVFTGAVDVGLNSAKYIYPGLGDFGDRFYGTESSSPPLPLPPSPPSILK